MYLSKIQIKNFRLLNESIIDLDSKSTIIVGKNNCGKTSVMDYFDLIYQNKKPSFDDYPVSQKDTLYKDFLSFLQNKITYDVLSNKILFPQATLTVDYSLDDPNILLGWLSKFIIDLDKEITTVEIDVNYNLTISEESLRKEFQTVDLSQESVLDDIKNVINRIYSNANFCKLCINAINPSDRSKKQLKTHADFSNLFPVFKISAERGLDESEQSNKSPLQPIMAEVFKAQLNESLKDVESEIDALKALCEKQSYDSKCKIDGLLNKITEKSLRFGYPSGEKIALVAGTNIELDKQIQTSTDLFYKDKETKEILPSTNNGLGYKNLIKIELKLLEYSNLLKDCSKKSIPLVFIEEPEAHMHPQMQQKFIEYIDDFCEKIIKQDIQTIITTHSSQIVYSASFEKIRYLKKEKDRIRVKSLKKYCSQPDNNKEFLEQYLTLNKCDLFFADKAILIEGTAERLLIPDMINKLACNGDFGKKDTSLLSQYYSLIEIGGAYAHKFISLMKFLEIPTLIITDIDSIKKEPGKQHATSCLVKDGQTTSNATIKSWMSSINKTLNTLQDVINLSEQDKTLGKIHLAYQVAENGCCGRSLEEAIKNANRTLFGISQTCDEKDIAYSQDIDGRKTDFAMELIFIKEKRLYNVPKYIKDGLIWLNAQEQD
jgi:predicted ATP-dependent endonuclease of OLD family